MKPIWFKQLREYDGVDSRLAEKIALHQGDQTRIAPNHYPQLEGQAKGLRKHH